MAEQGCTLQAGFACFASPCTRSLPCLPFLHCFCLLPCSLEYIKEAVAEADPVTGLAGLIKQRRRWLNGTFFAMIYTLSNWARIWTESHHRCVGGGKGVAAPAGGRVTRLSSGGRLAVLEVCKGWAAAGWLACSLPLPGAGCLHCGAHAPWLGSGPTLPHQCASPPPCSFMRKCVLSLEFVYLMIMTFAGTWFGISVFYTILYQLFLALFNGSELLQNVREGGCMAGGLPHGLLSSSLCTLPCLHL